MTKAQEVSLWAALAAFFGSILAIGTIEILNPNDFVKFATSLFVAAITGGAVYSRERLGYAKSRKNGPTKKETP